ncbi:hypothetical protein [Streptococcus intermedius]|uniref:hypothetical protein n=1 Tax=Streptococcus intermedius TaxID=1338 RepID=UPI000A954947|nr:hypothetical protein [Streptococcus intermedius]
MNDSYPRDISYNQTENALFGSGGQLICLLNHVISTIYLFLTKHLLIGKYFLGRVWFYKDNLFIYRNMM